MFDWVFPRVGNNYRIGGSFQCYSIIGKCVGWKQDRISRTSQSPFGYNGSMAKSLLFYLKNCKIYRQSSLYGRLAKGPRRRHCFKTYSFETRTLCIHQAPVPRKNHLAKSSSVENSQAGVTVSWPFVYRVNLPDIKFSLHIWVNFVFKNQFTVKMRVTCRAKCSP